jgi:hypothetical protein
VKLDKSKPFGEIFGAIDDRRYEQGGHIFDCDGEQLAAPASSESVPETTIRKRTKAEEEQYQKDVAEAAAIMAASNQASTMGKK